MVNAVLQGGEIRSLEPLPTEWRDGQPLRVEPAEGCDSTVEEIDRDFAVLESLCATSDTTNEELLDNALHEAHVQAKKQVRRQMGLT